MAASAARACLTVLSFVALQQRKRKGYKVACWGTFNQVKAAGGWVKKGEKSTLAIHCRIVERKETVDGVERTQKIPLFSEYYLFNVEQTQGLPARFLTEDELLSEAERLQGVQDFAQATGAEIWEGTMEIPCYSPLLDRIELPAFGQFKTAAAQASTLLHELAHWTGHKTRLDRIQVGTGRGGEEYAREELVAELGAAFLCADLGVQGELQHASYLAFWAQMLRNDKTVFFQAAKAAELAVTCAKTAATKGGWQAVTAAPETVAENG